VIDFLNTDFHFNQDQLRLISKLFTGALIHDKLTLMAITSKVYSRHATIDIHLETGVDSAPSSKCLYKGLSCSIIVSFDGKNLSKKLIIGSYTMKPSPFVPQQYQYPNYNKYLLTSKLMSAPPVSM
jgi:hypothetical protein